MFSFDPGTAPGLEREMIEGFAKSHAMRLEVVPVVHFEQIIPNLNNRLGDVILGIVDTETRRALVSFTDEVLPTRHVVVGLASRPQVRSLDQLRIQKVGVVTGSSWADAAANAGVPSNRIVAYVDTPAMTSALLSGGVNVVVMLARYLSPDALALFTKARQP